MNISICINTKNRLDYIFDTIHSFTNLKNKINFEIVIYDCGGNNLESFLNYNNVVYIIGDTADSIDSGYFNLLKYAKHEYVWLMTDDDLFNNIYLDEFINSLSLNNYDLYLLNANIFDSKMKYLIKRLAFNLNNSKKIKKDVYELNNLNYCINYLSFIGSIIVKKNLLIENNNNKYFDTYFNHVYTLINANINNILIIDLPILKIRAGNANWTYKSFQIWNYNWPKVVSFSENRNIIDSEIIISLKSILYYYAIGAIQKNELYNHKYHFLTKIFLFLILQRVNKSTIQYILYYSFILKNFGKINEQAYYIKQAILKDE